MMKWFRNFFKPSPRFMWEVEVRHSNGMFYRNYMIVAKDKGQVRDLVAQFLDPAFFYVTNTKCHGPV